MAVYMKVGKIQGDVSQTQHKDWIPLKSLEVPTERPDVNTTPGNVTDRTTSQIQFEDIEVSKYTDKASPMLMIWNIEGTTEKVLIDVCKEDGDLVLRLTLQDTICTKYKSSSDEEGVVEETISLDFTKIEYKFQAYDKKNKPAATHSVGYDLERARRT